MLLLCNQLYEMNRGYNVLFLDFDGFCLPPILSVGDIHECVQEAHWQRCDFWVPWICVVEIMQ